MFLVPLCMALVMIIVTEFLRLVSVAVGLWRIMRHHDHLIPPTPRAPRA